MYGKSKSRNKKLFGSQRAQALVEFSIALPVLLMLLIGIIEVGRMIFMYASVVNSIRDAVCYASAYGMSEDLGNGSFLKYKYCDGIRAAAKQSGFFLRLQNSDITITYDTDQSTTNPNGTYVGSCTTTGGEQSINVDTGARVSVEVRATYRPIVKLLPLGQRTCIKSIFVRCSSPKCRRKSSSFSRSTCSGTNNVAPRARSSRARRGTGVAMGVMQDILCSGHAACPGCIEALSARHVLATLGPDAIAVIPPSCLAIIAGPQPFSGLRIPVYQPSLESSAAAASGFR